MGHMLGYCPRGKVSLGANKVPVAILSAPALRGAISRTDIGQNF